MIPTHDSPRTWWSVISIETPCLLHETRQTLYVLMSLRHTDTIRRKSLSLVGLIRVIWKRHYFRIFHTINLIGTKSCESHRVIWYKISVLGMGLIIILEFGMGRVRNAGSGCRNRVCGPTEVKMKSENCHLWTKCTHIQTSSPVSVTWGVVL